MSKNSKIKFLKNVYFQNGFSKNQFVALAWPVAVQNIFKRCMGLGPSLAPTAAFGVWALAAGAFESKNVKSKILHSFVRKGLGRGEGD